MDITYTLIDDHKPDGTNEYWFRATCEVSLSQAVYNEDGDVRFVDRSTPRVTVFIDAYRVIRVTTKGVRIKCGGDDNRDTRFILRDARKRWACPTKHEAIESLEARTERRIKILNAQLNSAKVLLQALEQNLIREGERK